MDAFNCLGIIYYICQSRPNTILYSMISLFTIVESKLLNQEGLEKDQQGSTSPFRIRYDLRSFSVRCFISLSYWEGIDF